MCGTPICSSNSRRRGEAEARQRNGLGAMRCSVTMIRMTRREALCPVQLLNEKYPRETVRQR